MRQLFASLLLPLLACVAAAQPNPCLPASPVAADWPASAEALEKLFVQAQQKAELTPQAFEDLKAQTNRCNNDMEVALSGILSQMSELSLKYQQILGYKDVAGIEKQLRDLEESRKKSKTELEQNLGYVKHSGIFVVLLENVDFYKNEKKDLIAQANQSLSARAVEDLVGVNIRRSTEVRDFAPVRDVVQEIKNGEVRMEREYFNQPNHGKRHFLFVARFGATPARQKTAAPAPLSATALVLNLALDTDYRQRLTAKGLNDADIRRIEQEVSPFLPNVQRDNKTADSRQDYILQNGAEEIRRIEGDIDDARRRLATRSAKIGDICRELGVPFVSANFEQSVNAALQKIKDQLRELTAQWNQAAEREVLYKDTRTFVEGSLSQSLAAETLKLCGQIEKGYGQLDRILQVTEVENLDVTRFENSRTVTVFRAPKKIWAYAIPRDDGAYGVAVLVQFKVTGQVKASEYDKDESDKYEPAQVQPVKRPAKGGTQRLPYEPEMIKVEGGKFEMGCTSEQSDCDNDEKPVHRVQLDTFYIGKTEVTNEQFVAFLNDVPNDVFVESTKVTCYGNIIFDFSQKQVKYSRSAKADRRFNVVKDYEKRPVVGVNWFGATEYCKWLGTKTGRKYRLPTEAEWEYAARGGNKPKGFKYAGSNNINEVAWYDGNSGRETHLVAQKKANELGLFDLSGNVWEWCSDWYADTYPSAAQTNPPGPASGSYRVVRGGSWDRTTRDCRVSERFRNGPDGRLGNVGFRAAQDY